MTASITDQGAVRLCLALVKRAKQDYVTVVKYGDQPAYNRFEIEHFFRGRLFGAMVGDRVSPEEFMQRVLTDARSGVGR